MINAGRIIGIVLGFGLGIVGHELAHGFAADRLGDKTPRFSGRLTVRAKTHVDPVGTLVLPGLILLLAVTGQFAGFGFLYGYAKPIPVTASRLRNPKRDQILVALSGPATNLVLAAAAGFAARSVSATIPLVALLSFTTVQAFLFVVNLLPIPSLDGAKILGTFLSPQAAWKLEEYGQYLLLFLVVIVIIPPFRGAVGAMADPVCRAFTGASGCVL